MRLELHLSCSLEYHSATKSPWLPSKCGDRCAERMQTSWRLLASFARPGYMALPYCHISVKCADAAEGLCACVDANLMVRFGRVSIMYTTEYVCRSFEENTVRISLAHQTPFQRQVFPTRCWEEPLQGLSSGLSGRECSGPVVRDTVVLALRCARLVFSLW